MRLTDILSEERVTTQLTAASKDEALLSLAQLFARADSTPLEVRAVFDVLSERERLASTGIGSGVAIPHGRISALDRLQAALAICPQGIPFDAIDGSPVRIVVGVLAPQHHTGDHLRVLARVSRLLRNRDVRENLLAARTPHEAYEIIARADAG